MNCYVCRLGHKGLYLELRLPKFKKMNANGDKIKVEKFVIWERNEIIVIYSVCRLPLNEEGFIYIFVYTHVYPLELQKTSQNRIGNVHPGTSPILGKRDHYTILFLYSSKIIIF